MESSRSWARPAGIALVAAAACLPLLAGPSPAQSTATGEARRLVTLQGIRSATVAPHGLGFGSLGLTSELDGSGEVEPSLSLGFGLGDASRNLGLQFTANILSGDEDFGDEGSLSVKASRRIGPAGVPTFVGLSADRLAGWGDSAGGESVSAALTAFPQVDLGGAAYPLMLTLGAGSRVRDDQTEPGLYAGAGIGLTPNLGASLAWAGESFTLGSAFRFDDLESLRLSASVHDVFDQDDGPSLTLAATFLVRDLLGR